MKLITKSFLIAGGLALGTALHAADAKKNWEDHCKSCHGVDGKGQTTMGKKAGCKDYTDPKVQEALKDEKAFKATKEGLKEGDKELMKPFAAKLTDDDIKELVKHLRTFKK